MSTDPTDAVKRGITKWVLLAASLIDGRPSGRATPLYRSFGAVGLKAPFTNHPSPSPPSLTITCSFSPFQDRLCASPSTSSSGVPSSGVRIACTTLTESQPRYPTSSPGRNPAKTAGSRVPSGRPMAQSRSARTSRTTPRTAATAGHSVPRPTASAARASASAARRDSSAARATSLVPTSASTTGTAASATTT